MLKRIRKAMNAKEQGFTLIELLVVIIIIGILAAIAIPVFLNQRKKAVDAGIKSDVKNVATAIETLFTDNPSWASPTATGSWSSVQPDGSIGVGWQQNWGQSTPADIHLTEGNVVLVRATPDGYCIKGYNPMGSNAVSEATAIAYDSSNGGLQESGYVLGACA